MTEHNPYDFLSGDASPDSASPDGAPERSERDKSVFEQHAPEATVPRADSVAALAAREAYESQAYEHNGGSADLAGADLATVPELAPLAEPQSAQPSALESAPESAESSMEVAPPSSDSERYVLKQDWPDNEPPQDHEQDLFEHLGELRMRMLRSITYVLVASVATWQYTPRIQEWVLSPVQDVLDANNIGTGTPSGTIIMTDPTEGFVTYFQMSIIAALILAAPFILWEMWRFIEPALTRREKRYSGFLLPFSTLLFFTGCSLGYLVSPMFFKFFLGFNAPGVATMWTYQKVVVLLGKMLLVFGVCFQVPVVVIFLNKAGVVTRNVLIEYWRHVVVVIFVIVSIITPTWDPFTLLVCAVPPCVLYAVSVWLIKWL